MILNVSREVRVYNCIRKYRNIGVGKLYELFGNCGGRMWTMHRAVVTLCGTSLLTNTAPDREMRGWLTANSNKKKSDFTADDRVKLDAHIDHAREVLFAADMEGAQKLSAELNALIEMYRKEMNRRGRDAQYLLHSDTHIGERTAEVLKDWLEKHGFSVQLLHVIQGMTTDNSEDFHWGVSELAGFCDEWIRPLRGRSRVVFNLAGGFKATQGILNTLGMLYADELIYIFERGGLIRIPRLPVTMDADSAVGKHLPIFRRMSLGIPASREEVDGIAEALLWPEDNSFTLSGWGGVAWLTARDHYYAKGLLASPIDQIQYGPNFERSVANSGFNDRIVKINERIDDLAAFILSNGKKNLKRLDFKPLQGGAKAPCTHEVDVFADRAAPRIYLEKRGNTFVLHELGEHL